MVSTILMVTFDNMFPMNHDLYIIAIKINSILHLKVGRLFWLHVGCIFIGYGITSEVVFACFDFAFINFVNCLIIFMYEYA